MESDPAVTRFTARGNEIVSEAGNVVARLEHFGWARRMIRVTAGSNSYSSRSFWHQRTFQESDTGRTVIALQGAWLSSRFRLVFPSGESLHSSSISRAICGRLSLSDERGIVIEVFPSDGAPPPDSRDQRRHPGMNIVVYRKGIPELLLVILLAVNAIRDTPSSPAVSGAGWGAGAG